MSAPDFFLYNSFNNMFGLLYQSLMLHNIFENRKSLKIWSLRPHEILTLFSKAGSRLPTLCSITSPCFDAVRKHLKRILQIFEIFYNFLKEITIKKKSRLLHFRIVFLLNIFLVSPEGPQILQKMLAALKSSTNEVDFFRNGFIIFRI